MRIPSHPAWAGGAEARDLERWGLKYPGMLPRLETQLLKNKRTVAWNGHSIPMATKSPDKFLNDVRTKY